MKDRKAYIVGIMKKFTVLTLSLKEGGDRGGKEAIYIVGIE